MKKIASYLKAHRPDNFINYLSLFLLIYFILVRLLYIASYSIDLAGMEFSFIFQQQFMEKYNILYADPDKFPYYISFYPPIYPYFMKLVLNVFNIDAFNDLHQAFIAGRFISFLCLIVVVYFILKTIDLFSKVKYQLYLLLLLFILLIPQHFYTFRPDSLKVLMFSLFLYQLLKYDFFQASKKHLLIDFAAAILSVYIKHDVIIYISLYFFIHFLIFRRHKKLFHFALFLFLVFFLFELCHILKGNQFIHNIFYYNLQYSSKLRGNIELSIANTIRLLPLLIICFINMRSDKKHVRFIAFYSIASFIISSLLLLRAASNFNYTYESVILLMVNTGIFFQEKNLPKINLAVIYLFLLLLFNQKVLYKIFDFGDELQTEKINYLTNIQTSKKLEEIIKNDVVFFPAGKFIVFYGKLNLLYGYDLHLDRFTELYLNKPVSAVLYNNNSTSAYDKSFQNGFVKYIVIEETEQSLKQMRLYYKKYVFSEKCGNLLVYKFNAAS